MPTMQRMSRVERLTDTLTARFRQDAESPELPLIIENSLPTGRGIHLVVIWEELESMDQTSRERMIRYAFARAHPVRRHCVTLVRGLTSTEALKMGYLRYKIEPTFSRGDNIPSARILQAMKTVGGILIKVGRSIELRFATLEQTHQAYRRLLGILNGPYWAIVQESDAN